MTRPAVERLFETVGPRFGDREGGYLRIVRLGHQRGDGAEKVFIELLGSEKIQEAKREKRAAARAKRVEEAKKAAAAAGEGQPEGEAEGEKESDKEK